MVIEDLTSHYPIAKLVKLTCAKSVIAGLEYVYDRFGNLVQQESGNRFLSNSMEMENFTKNRNIEQVKTPTGHPSP